ncbi:dCTP deaminase [Candidatus Pacearchaeota archaeon]|nr:dCTP deaminase [Candidatus Pacearchaeota archaeon]
MILTKNEILKLIREKKIKIKPLTKNSIGPASIDLTLDNKIRIFTKENSYIEIKENTDYKKLTKIIDITKGYIIKSEELVLGITKEKITLPENICGWLNSRSRFARLGLMSHITAPFVCPGISNKQILEIYNAGNHPIRLIPNIKICQLVLQECKGFAKYQGKFKSQEL